MTLFSRALLTFLVLFLFRTTDKLTPCQEAYKKAIQNPKVGGYIPRCKDDGGFENMQCGGTSGQCWCVDKDGTEIPGTRTTKNLQCPDPGIYGYLPLDITFSDRPTFSRKRNSRMWF